MKQCPVCKTTYTDETLKFCLADGANLISVTDAEKTIAMSFDNNQMRSNRLPDSVPTVFSAAQQTSQPARKGVSPLIVAVLCLLFLLFAGGLIGFASYVWFKPGVDKNLTAVNSSTPTPAVSPTSDKENAELKQKLANLEKQVADQKNQKKTAPAETFSTPTSPPPTTERTARANSPGDGFLALRSDPNSETGYRIAKIPHGATVTVLGCPKPASIGKTAGHWCQVDYNGQSGWAFDGFLTF